MRSVRSRQAVVTAWLDLVAESGVVPTVQQVSDRSGVSMSSIFRLFDDAEDMSKAAVRAQVDRIGHLFLDPPLDGTRRQRVDNLLTSRAALYEEVAPIRRVAMAQAAASDTVRQDLENADAIMRAQVQRVFAPELEALAARPRKDLLDMLDALTSFEVWDRLRTRQGLPVARAKAILASTLLATVGS